ncbi:MAG: zinc ribbon domain-containing protein [Clostridia bacterium]|nr:zinc ribbon domain-containing protein [Clostridia bacterium]
MWICQKCQTQNRDGMQACPVCGTMRAAGRFGSAPPRVTAAAPQMQEPSSNGSIRTGYQPPEENARAPRAARGKSGRLARLVGVLLCVLLPAMTLLLSWQQREILRPVLASLFVGQEAPEWLNWTCYGVLSLAAALVALLPGLWTLLLNGKRK